MKKHYSLLLLTCLAAGLPVAGQAQVTLSGPVTLYIAPGSLMTVPSSLTVGTGAILTNEGLLDFGGDLINNGIVTAPVAPAAMLRAVGTAGPQTVTGTAALPVQNLTVNNTAGVTINTNLSVSGTITLTNGLVSVGTGTPLVLLPTATNPVETATAHLVGPVTMAARVVNGTTFGPFLGLSMPAGASVANLTVTRVTGPTAITSAAGNTSAAVYWDVATTAAGAPTRVMNFSWLGVLDNGRDMAQATPWRSTTLFTNWTRTAGPTANAAATDPRQYAPSGAVAEAVAGRFTLADPNAPLPVELTAFSVRRQGPDARLDWNTASEKNNAYFDVERSRDGLVFERTGQVVGQGNSSTPRNYFFIDPKVVQFGVPTLYYRLRQVDVDGMASYSPVRTVAVESTTALLVSAWPNPSTGAGPHIRVEQPFDGPLTAILIDATGRRLTEYHTTNRLSEELFRTEISALPSGVYLLSVTTPGTSRTLRLMRN
ncbi:T9SS type A sorting domain-containing protein [Hymenobacter terrenus]|uniref:T9SS type A sorting domain-containing protein n=1 Tax=Hymenobacter terrenus TaxID=1629124 RepID=UPI00069680FD|nr:T9SS type A sorting domain-containing protein [Hymenobacter terrenus]